MLFWKKKTKQSKKKKPTKSPVQPKKPEVKQSPHPKKAKPPVPESLPKKKEKTPEFIRSDDIEKDFLKAFNQLTYRVSPYEVWQDFVSMFACALSNPVDKAHYDEREKLYLRTIKKYNGREQKLFPELAAHTVMALERNPEQDFLGHIFMGLGLGNKHKCQEFTPYSVCQCMAGISMNDVAAKVQEKGYITINDPCCGAGATLIAGVNEARKQLVKENLNFQNYVLVCAQDIDYTAAMMCYIQLSLLGVAACIKVGNSLTEPMTENDTDENYWYTPMYFSQIWTMRRIFHGLEKLT